MFLPDTDPAPGQLIQCLRSIIIVVVVYGITATVYRDMETIATLSLVAMRIVSKSGRETHKNTKGEATWRIDHR